MQRSFFFLLALVVSGLVSGTARAQLSPGKLSQPHADLDSSRACLECHSTGKGVAGERCLACHEILAERIAAGAGFHARMDDPRCATCHIEHHGREFELIWWGEAGIDAFDHDETGHPLVGAHDIGCRECHRASKIPEPQPLLAAGKDLDRTFLGLDTDCAACHRDPHRGQLAPRGCTECHGQTTWSPAEGFDHAQTSFALDGRHAQVECAQCHTTETAGDGSPWVRYRGTPTTCADCHRDPHAGRLGRECAACHGTADWHAIDRDRFDHGRTRFPLLGRHQRVDCTACHRGGSFRVAGFERCATCHEDAHLGQFRDRPGGGACADCHDTRGFAPSRFDLADHAETRFPLEGAHRSVPCAECHATMTSESLVALGVALAESGPPTTAQRFVFETTDCIDCHHDPHAGSADGFLGTAGCKSCHDGESWRVVPRSSPSDNSGFDHATTDFALVGAHLSVACVECHTVTGRDTEEVVLDFGGAPTTCRGCHGDPHLGQLDRPGQPAICDQCHSNEGWVPSLFDHNDSAFPLEGAHTRTRCDACHRVERIDEQDVVRYRPLPTACSGCHRAPEATEASGAGEAGR